jgi:cation transport ATPase
VTLNLITLAKFGRREEVCFNFQRSALHFVTATLIPLFLEIGRTFEERSSVGARATIEAVKWLHSVEERVDPNTLRPGDEILVRPGERIAVDGTVLEGRSAVDQSAITGESLHEDVGPGSPVFAGSVALDGLLRIQVRGADADTVLGKVVELLAEVERTTVPVLRLFEQRAGVWLPLVLTLAGTTLFSPERSLTRDRDVGCGRANSIGSRRTRSDRGRDERGDAAPHPD